MTPGMWEDAMRALEAQLRCPKCDAQNSPSLRPIAVDHRGEAACDNCGHGGPLQLFIPDHLKEKHTR